MALNGTLFKSLEEKVLGISKSCMGYSKIQTDRKKEILLGPSVS